MNDEEKSMEIWEEIKRKVGFLKLKASGLPQQLFSLRKIS
jgi:hypothetical protein